jgi:hypothetical protein
MMSVTATSAYHIYILLLHNSFLPTDRRIICSCPSIVSSCMHGPGQHPIACTNRLKGQGFSGCKLQRLRRIRIWKQNGSVALEHWPSGPHPSGRRTGKDHDVLLVAPHPLPHPHLLLMRRRGAVKRDIGGLLVVERRFEGRSLGFGLISGQEASIFAQRCWYTKTAANLLESLI